MKDPTDHNKLVVDEFASRIVRDIFKWRLAGHSNLKIAGRLNDLGVLSPYEYKRAMGHRYRSSFKTGDKAAWSAMTVKRILCNEVYTGVLEQGKRTSISYKIRDRIDRPKEEWIRIENSHKAIITRKDFELAAQLLKKDLRTAPGKNSLYTLSGLLVCGGCGQPMVRKLVPSDGKKYAYYVCSTNKRGEGCKPHSTGGSLLEEAVFKACAAQIEYALDFKEILSYIVALPPDNSVGRLKAQIAAKEQELAKYQQRRLMLYEDLQDDIIDEEEFTQFSNGFAALASEAEAALTRLQNEMEKAKANSGAEHCWIEHFKASKSIKILCRGLAVRLVDKIVVHAGGRIEICFSFGAT